MTKECGKAWARTNASACWSVVKYAVSLGLLAACIGGAAANDKTDYDRRAAANDTALFQSLDRNKDGRVTLLEAHGDLNLGPRFDDMDIDRDGVVTLEELQRYIAQQHGIQVDQALR
jgi:hypothetical protein